MRKILILYASYGNGHKSAAYAIKDFLEQNHSNDVEIKILDSYEYINQLLNTTTVKGYEFVTNKTPRVWNKIYTNAEKGMLSKVSTEVNRIMSNKLTKLINSFNPDIIVSTHMFNNNMCGRLKRKGKINCKIVSILTDFALHNEWLVNAEYIDTFFVSNEAMKLDLIKRGFSERKIIVSGIPISPRFYEEYNKDTIRKEFNLKNKTTILFFAASTYSFNSMDIVFKNLLNLNDIQLIVLCGKSEKSKQHLKDILESSNTNVDVTLLSFTKKIPELMQVSDFVITKPGGLTSSEALACNIPLIICNPIPGQEEQNSNFFLNNGVAIRLFDNDDMEITLKNFFNNKKRIEQLKDMTKVIGKPNSTKDICEFILNSNSES